MSQCVLVDYTYALVVFAQYQKQQGYLSLPAYPQVTLTSPVVLHTGLTSFECCLSTGTSQLS